MYSLFIGCDLSKVFLDVSYYQQGSVYVGQFPNNIEGFEQMCTVIESQTQLKRSTWFVLFENTGEYSKTLMGWLAGQDIAFREENALVIKRSLGLRRGKNDKSDSMDLCKYAFEKRDSIQPSELPSALIVKLKKLLSRRDLLVKHKRSLTVSFNEQKKNLDRELLPLFKSQTDASVDLHQQQIDQLEALIRKTIDQDPDMRKNYGLILTVVGIGPITAAYLLAYTHNFTQFSCARKFASYAGTAPFLHYQSGTTKGSTRVSQLANKKLKSLLGMCVRAALQFDSQIKHYYVRKVNEGKPKQLVMNNVKNKLIQRVFATIKRQSPFVPLKAYA